MGAKPYGYKWQQARAGYLAHHPLCREHEKAGQYVQATVVDHITPHKGNMELFWDKDNWQPLCKACHDSKTAREDGGLGNAPSTKPRQGCTVDGLPTDKRHHWHR